MPWDEGYNQHIMLEVPVGYTSKDLYRVVLQYLNGRDHSVKNNMEGALAVVFLGLRPVHLGATDAEKKELCILQKKVTNVGDEEGDRNTGGHALWLFTSRELENDLTVLHPGFLLSFSKAFIDLGPWKNEAKFADTKFVTTLKQAIEKSKNEDGGGVFDGEGTIAMRKNTLTALYTTSLASVSEKWNTITEKFKLWGDGKTCFTIFSTGSTVIRVLENSREASLDLYMTDKRGKELKDLLKTLFGSGGSGGGDNGRGMKRKFPFGGDDDDDDDDNKSPAKRGPSGPSIPPQLFLRMLMGAAGDKPKSAD